MSGPELLIEQAFASSHTAKLVLPFCGEDGATSIRAWALKIFPKIQAEQEPLANGSLPDDLVVAKRAVRLSVHRWFDSNLEQMPLEMFDGILLQGSKEDAAIQGEDFKEKIMEGLRAADARKKERSSKPEVLTEAQVQANAQLLAIFSRRK